jgi:cobalt-zinc-cadmium efflux system outer membrane protein
MWAALTYRIWVLIGLSLLLSLLSSLGPMVAWSDERGALTLALAIERALASHPSLAFSGFEREIEAGRLRQAGIRPRVGLDLEVENFLGSEFYEGFAQAETTLSLVWVLERGKRQSRLSAAQAAVDATGVTAELRRLDVAADTADAFLEVLMDQERLQLATEAVRLGEQARTVVAERVEVGRSSAIDLARAEADLSWRRLAEEDVSHELLVSKRTLASQWGAGRADFAMVEGDLSDHATPDSYTELLSRVAASPGINRYLTQGRVKRAELALVEAQSRPDWLLRAGARHLGTTDEVAFVTGVTLPIGRANPGLGRIDSARAAAALADAELVARRVEIETTLYRLHQELSHNLHRAEAISREVIPLLDSVVRDAEASYAAGRFSYFELRQAQLSLLEARQTFLEENYLGQRNRVAIERLTGASVGSSPELSEENP